MPSELSISDRKPAHLKRGPCSRPGRGRVCGPHGVRAEVRIFVRLYRFLRPFLRSHDRVVGRSSPQLRQKKKKKIRLNSCGRSEDKSEGSDEEE